MKTKPTHRARRMWANYYPDADGFVCLHGTRTYANANAVDDCSYAAVPVAVIPLDDVSALVQLATEAYFNAWNAELATRKEAMRAALTAIGVLPKQRKGGAK